MPHPDASFPHESLDVYRASIQFVEGIDALIRSFPKGRAASADPLRRATTSVVLNIAEGSGGFAPIENARISRIALRSASECAAALHLVITDRSRPRSRSRNPSPDFRLPTPPTSDVHPSEPRPHSRRAADLPLERRPGEG